MAMYTFVPVTSLLLLGFLALAPQLFWKYKPDERRSHPPYFPFPLPEFILSASLWSLAYLLRTPIFTIVSALVERLSPVLATFLFNLTHVLTYNLFRLSSLPILRLRDAMASTRPTWHDPVFYRVWWLALGWASIDVAVSIWQSYGQLALYRGVMVPADRVGQVLAQSSSASLLSSSQEALPLSPCTDAGKGTVDDAIRAAVDQDLEQLVALKEREDLEEIYGLPIVVRLFCTLKHDMTLTLLRACRKYPCSSRASCASTPSCSRQASRSRSPRHTCTPSSRCPCPASRGPRRRTARSWSRSRSSCC